MESLGTWALGPDRKLSGRAGNTLALQRGVGDALAELDSGESKYSRNVRG